MCLLALGLAWSIQWVAMSSVRAHPAASEAVKALTERIQRLPQDGLLYVERARQWRLEGAYDHARRDLSRALRMEPGLAAAYHEWGLVELANGREQRALRRLDAAIDADPNWWRPRRRRALLLQRRGESAAAIEDLKVVLAVRGSPDDFAATAKLLRELERPEQAAALLREGAESTGAVVLATMAIDTYRALGWYEEAFEMLSYAERMGGDPFAAAVTKIELGLQMGAWTWAYSEAVDRERVLHELFSRRATSHRRTTLTTLASLREDAQQLQSLPPHELRARACLPSLTFNSSPSGHRSTP